MNYNEYYDFIRQRMAEALYERHAGGFNPYIYQPRQEREINPDFKPTPKPVAPQKVKIVREIFYPDRYTNMVSRQVLTETGTTLCDDRGEPVCFDSIEEAHKAVNACKKMVSLWN